MNALGSMMVPPQSTYNDDVFSATPESSGGANQVSSRDKRAKGSFFSNLPGTPHKKTKVETPRGKDGAGSGPGKKDDKFDQNEIDHSVGNSSPGGQPNGGKGAPGTSDEPPLDPDIIEYRKKQAEKFQMEKDGQKRDSLFGQQAVGRVDGKDAGEFSSESLTEAAGSLSDSAKIKAEKAAPARNGSLVRTAAIAVPFSALGLTVAGTANALLKPYLDPSSKAGATQEDIKNGEIVNHIQKDVFTAANALNDLRGAAHVAPGLAWAMKNADERMDVLEDMVGYIEKEIGSEAQKLGIPYTLPSTGALKDDIPGRATDINSRLALLTSLFKAMASKLKAD